MASRAALFLPELKKAWRACAHSTLKVQGQSEWGPLQDESPAQDLCLQTLHTPIQPAAVRGHSSDSLLLPPVFLTTAGPGQHRAPRAYVSVRPPA